MLKASRFYTFVFFNFIFAFKCFPQNGEEFKPALVMESDVANFQESIKKNYAREIAKISSSYKKQIAEAYKERETMLEKLNQHGVILRSGEIYNYINSIFKNIVKNNPTIPANEIQIVLKKDAVPNASCTGEGTILINMGIISKMETEGELAFIICHEIAHYTLNHVDNAVLKYINYINSRSTQDELVKIRHGEYNKTERAVKLLKGMLYSGRKHGRLNEHQADSQAVAYLKNTIYPPYVAINCLQKLDSIDIEKTPVDLNLKNIFNCQDYPFKDRWLIENDGQMKFKQKKDIFFDLNQDSLKTHPDCKARITALASIANKSETLNSQSNPALQKISQLSQFELIESLFAVKNYSKCLYQSLRLLQRFPKEPYLHAMVGKTLYYIFDYQKKHQLGNHIDFISSETDTNYAKVLHFISNLRMAELANLSYHYLKEKRTDFAHNEEFLFALYLACGGVENVTEKKSIAQIYNAKFPKGRYADEIIITTSPIKSK